MRNYRSFWAKSFGLGLRELNSREFRTVTSCPYLQKFKGKYIFLFTDLTRKNRILAAPESRLEDFWSQTARLQFNDIDYGLPSKSSFRPVELKDNGLSIVRLTAKNKKAIRIFYRGCSKKDRDTLDLTFKNEFALGLMRGQKILGIARYARLRDSRELVDITVVLLRSVRGKGYSTPLVSKLIEKLLDRGFIPRYRVAEENTASRSIAARLGLRPMFSLKTYR